MIKFVREDFAFLLLVILWVLATNFLGPVIFALLPLSVFVLRGREQFAEIMFGFLIVLILSDIDPMFVAMRRLKTAKYAYMIALAMIVIIDRRRFVPLAGLFPIFLPFFAYSFLPLVASMLNATVNAGSWRGRVASSRRISKFDNGVSAPHEYGMTR